MVTKLIGVREFRRNMATLCEKARKNNWRFVVLSHNRPIFKIEPLSEKEANLEKLVEEIKEARNDVKKGRIYTSVQIRKNLGL
ncbi:MAG: hypothetical protein ACD_72C00462G0003 [uncultured bacterium]|nr:MAG: hypothetical protein ACD_72C00462G0003 [uncultured bacterium]